MFYVGQKVVCIKTGHWAPQWYKVPNKPKAGGIYTIRNFSLLDYCNALDVPSVWLVEIINERRNWSNPLRACPLLDTEFGFPVYIFRPLKETKTDISVFKEMLKEKELAQ